MNCFANITFVFLGKSRPVDVALFIDEFAKPIIVNVTVCINDPA